MAGLLSSFISSTSQTNKSDFKDDKFKVGQVWNYKTRLGEETSTIKILKIEEHDTAGIIVHICVSEVKLNNSESSNGLMEDIGHLPFSKEALLKSITTLVTERSKLPDFKEGYKIWKKAFDSGEGGIFSIEVKDAVSFVEETFNTGPKSKN